MNKLTDEEVQSIKEFIAELVSYEWNGNSLIVNNSRRINMNPLDNGNVRFESVIFVNDGWLPMGTIEVESYQRHYWTRIVEVVRAYAGASFMVSDQMVAAQIAANLAGAALLAQERVRETVVVPRSEPRAGARNPTFEGTIRSKGKTGVLRTEDDEDILG